MTTIDIDPDTPLKIGDSIQAGSFLGVSYSYTVIGVVNDNVYEIKAEGSEQTQFIRRARHKAGVENGIFVYVERNARGKWVRTETGPAFYWACHPSRATDDLKK